MSRRRVALSGIGMDQAPARAALDEPAGSLAELLLGDLADRTPEASGRRRVAIRVLADRLRRWALDLHELARAEPSREVHIVVRGHDLVVRADEAPSAAWQTGLMPQRSGLERWAVPGMIGLGAAAAVFLVLAIAAAPGWWLLVVAAALGAAWLAVRWTTVRRRAAEQRQHALEAGKRQVDDAQASLRMTLAQTEQAVQPADEHLAAIEAGLAE